MCPSAISKKYLSNRTFLVRKINFEYEICEKIHYFNTWIYVVPQTTGIKQFEKFYSVVPKANLTELILPFKSEFENFTIKNSKNSTASVQNFEDLNNAGCYNKLI